MSEQIKKLAELRAISANLQENNKKQQQMLDYRFKELEVARQRLYVEVEQFKEMHQSELRRGVEVAFDLASRSLPWWKRSRENVKALAALYLGDLGSQVRAEFARIKEELRKQEEKQKIEEEENARREAKANKVVAPVDGYGSAVTEEPVTNAVHADHE